MEEGGEWGNGISADSRSERRGQLQFQEVDAHLGILGRRNDLGRGTYNLLAADGRLPSKEVLSNVQWRLNSVFLADGVRFIN